MAFKEQLELATSPGPTQIPGAVVIAADRSGNIIDFQAIGVTSVDPDIAKPMTEDTTFWIASCTKLITSIAALQCVERGQLTLDDDVSTILHQLKTPDILVGFDEQTGQPILKKAQEHITLRQLLTHSSGNVIELFSAEVKKWREWAKPTYDEDEGEVDGREGQWGVRLGEYMKRYIFGPLDMTSTGFRPSENEKIRNNLSATTVRTPKGGLRAGKPFLTGTPKDDLGGGGLYSSATDYIKVLISILKNDEKLLKRETVDLMFTPQLPDPKYLEAVVNDQRTGVFYRSGVDGQRWNYGLGGLLNMEDAEGVCKKGTMSWGGLPNLFWWIDPASGTCGMYASQLLPPGDAISRQLAVDFRRSIVKGSY
ncbi:hypothetical protein LTR84_012939 [Exophiala bonariae]|uniref:Beta-lactamase-related domain-containing protein n=1 Tax=Exophiala bonariae TaxID=1690606 RepID=A0AAV9NDH1_9EURO|nr:hypothetical protein LTR84_012939 [Exophiala bonariae]